MLPNNIKPLGCYLHISAGTQTDYRGYELENNPDYSGNLTEVGYPFLVKNKPSVDSGYTHFETLNMLFSLMKDKSINQPFLTPLIKSGNPSDCCSLAAYREHSGYIVGVDATAQLIGEHIMHNLFCILEAIQRGHQEALIFGHSRGGAAALLTAHELDRLKQDTSNQSLYDLLLETPCNYTKKALEKISSEQKTWLNVHAESIRNALKAFRITMLLLDPVPGDGLLPKSASIIGWDDTRFKTIPQIVSQIEMIYALDERTVLYRPIKPTLVTQETVYTETLAPGHHGTVIGNLNEHDGNAKFAMQREHMQKIAVLKGLYAMHMKGIALSEHIPSTWLTSEETYQRELLFLYDEVYKNLDHYRSLRNKNMLTNAPILGYFLQESGTKGERLTSRSTDIPPSEVLSSPLDAVNAEHLALREKFHVTSYSLR